MDKGRITPNTISNSSIRRRPERLSTRTIFTLGTKLVRSTCTRHSPGCTGLHLVRRRGHLRSDFNLTRSRFKSNRNYAESRQDCIVIRAWPWRHMPEELVIQITVTNIHVIDPIKPGHYFDMLLLSSIALIIAPPSLFASSNLASKNDAVFSNLSLYN